MNPGPGTPARPTFAAGAPRSGAAVRDLALVGNPNVGKSVIFGALTRRYVTVSNYPGTTIEVTRGSARIDGRSWQVLDTPGTNQLTPMSEDERVTRDILLDSPEALVLQVADAKNLRRALVLTLELAEMGMPVVLALNMQDEARSRGVRVDRTRLEEILGVPVVETVATRRYGIGRLEESLGRGAEPRTEARYPAAIERWIGNLLPHLAREGRRARFLALQILSGDASIEPYLRARLPQADLEALDALRREAVALLGHDLSHQIRSSRLESVDRILEQVYQHDRSVPAGWSARLARWALHPVKGTLILAFLLYGMFWFVGLFGAGTLVDLMEGGLFGQVINPLFRSGADAILPFPHVHEYETVTVALELPLSPAHAVPLGSGWERSVPTGEYSIPAGVELSHGQDVLRFLHDLLVGPYGALTMGLSYGLAIVLPIVATFFLLFSVMEDSGYLPRLAVMVNRIFRSMGLNGKAVLPMVLGLGCDTMATMTTRILETRKQRLIVTLLLALGVPCSAQLGVLLAMVSHVSPLGSIVWLTVITGVMISVGWLAARLFPGENSDFLLELPPIRRPVLSNIIVKTLARVEWYLREVVPLFLLGTVLLFILDRTHALEALRTAASPVVEHWLGLPRQAADAFIVGFLRRDYGAVFLLDAASGPNPIMNGTQVVISMIVITLFVPCIANVFIIIKEHGWKTAAAMAGFIFPFAFFVGGVVRFTTRFLGMEF